MSAAFLYGLVILSAIAHPVWNAMVKSAGDRTLTMVAIRVAGLLLGLATLPFVDWPAPESWKWLILTAGVQFGYYALLVRSYGVGDMSVVYPLARGLAPVLTTVAAFLAIGEALSSAQTAAVALISLGIMALSLRAGASREAVGFALATGVAVATYSFFGGMGVRSAGTVLGFQACLEVVTGAISVLGFLAYLAAARSLPLGPVTALRETSVIFGAVIGTLVLKEGFGWRRITAATLVLGGIVLLAAGR
jgi:drug/metabolite transporter (DMT)-like permease